MAIGMFQSFISTVNPFLPRDWPRNFRLLCDNNNYPVGIQNGNGWANGQWTPVDLTADQIASPDPLIIADLNSTFRLNVAPYTQYRSNGTTLVQFITSQDFETYLMSLPTSDAGLSTGQPFWNGAFLCRKV